MKAPLILEADPDWIEPHHAHIWLRESLQREHWFRLAEYEKTQTRLMDRLARCDPAALAWYNENKAAISSTKLNPYVGIRVQNWLLFMIEREHKTLQEIRALPDDELMRIPNFSAKSLACWRKYFPQP